MATNRNIKITENTKYYKISQLSEMYQISRYSIYGMIANGVIPAIKIGNKMLILKTDWDAYIEKSRVNPNDVDIEALAKADAEEENEK